MMGWEVARNVGGERRVRIRVRIRGGINVMEAAEGTDDGGILGVGGGEDEEGALRGVVEEKEEGCGEGEEEEAGGEDDETAIGVLQEEEGDSTKR